MSNKSHAGVVPFEQARAIIEQYCERVTPSGADTTSLLSASGRVLAEPILADRDFPPFPRATRDGYALRAADVQSLPAVLEVVGEIRAGMAQVPTVGPGQAVAIMTGAAAPSGADTIVMIEHTSRTGDHVQIQRSISEGENIVPAGAEAKHGDKLLSPGTRLGYAEIAVAASVGRSRLLVHAKPRV